MSKYYLLSNSPDRTRVSLLDTDLPPDEQCRTLMLWGVSQRPVLYREETLDTYDWVEEAVGCLPPEDRLAPDLFLLTCAGDCLKEGQAKLSHDVKLVSEYDAAAAYYEAQQKALSSAGPDANVILLTSGREGFRAERLGDAGLEVLRFTPGTAALDHWLAEHMLEENPQAQALYQEDPEVKRDLRWEMRELRHIFVELAQEGHTEVRRGHWINGAGSLTLEVSLAAMAAISPRVSHWLWEFGRFLDQIQAQWGVPDVVLCCGKDWMMEDLLDALADHWPSARLCCAGAQEAAGRGLELLAPTLLKLRTWEKTWSLTLCTDKELSDTIQNRFNEKILGRLRVAFDIGQIMSSTLYRWQAADFRRGEIMEEALKSLEQDFSSSAKWSVYSWSDSVFLDAVGAVERRLGQTLLDGKAEKEEACQALWGMLSPCFSHDWLACLKQWMKLYYSPIVALLTDHVSVVDVFNPTRDRQREKYQLMLDNAGATCRQRVAARLEATFPLEEKSFEYLSLVYQTIQQRILRNMERHFPYPCQETLAVRERLAHLWSALPAEFRGTSEELHELRDQLWFLND